MEYFISKSEGLSPALRFGKMLIICILLITLANLVFEMALIYSKTNYALWAALNWTTCLQSFTMAAFDLQVIALFSVLLPKSMRFVTKINVGQYQLISTAIGVVLCGGYLTRFWAYSDADPNMKAMVLVSFYRISKFIQEKRLWLILILLKYRGIGFVIWAFPVYVYNVFQAMMLMYGSHQHLMTISQNNSENVAHIIARTNRMIRILGCSIISVIFAGISYTLGQFVYSGSNPETLGPSFQCMIFSSNFQATYVIMTAFAFEDLVYNQLHSASNTGNRPKPKPKILVIRSMVSYKSRRSPTRSSHTSDRSANKYDKPPPSALNSKLSQTSDSRNQTEIETN